METLKTSIFIFKTLSNNSVTEGFSETLFVTWKSIMKCYGNMSGGGASSDGIM